MDFWYQVDKWKISGFNTLTCLLGCSIGDFGTILYFQIYTNITDIYIIMPIGNNAKIKSGKNNPTDPINITIIINWTIRLILFLVKLNDLLMLSIIPLFSVTIIRV